MIVSAAPMAFALADRVLYHPINSSENNLTTFINDNTTQIIGIATWGINSTTVGLGAVAFFVAVIAFAVFKSKAPGELGVYSGLVIVLAMSLIGFVPIPLIMILGLLLGGVVATYLVTRVPIV